MDSEGSGGPSGSDLVVQNRTEAMRHATVRCQTSTSTIFSEMIELDSGETATYDDLPQELIKLQVDVADGPKGSKMYDAETVPGTVAVGIFGSDVPFETTTDPVASASALDDVFDDGGIEEASAPEPSPQSAGNPGREGVDDTDAPDRDPSDADGPPREPSDTADSTGSGADRANSDREGSDAGGATWPGTEAADPDRDAADAAGTPERTDRRTRKADAAGSGSSDASKRTDRRSDPDAAGTSGTDASNGTNEQGATGEDDRTAGADSAGTPSATAETPSDDERGPSADEIHCRNCGEIILTNAEICPECGTRNAAQGSRRRQSTGARDTDDTARGDAPSTSGQPAADDSEQEPGPDEIYCRNCGEIIRQRAEICPECGVQNAVHDGAPSGGSGSSRAPRGGGAAGGGTAPPAQPSGPAGGGSTTQRQSTGSEPSGSWVNGVRFGGLLWFLALLILVPTVLQYQRVTTGSGLDPGGMLQSLGLAALLPPIQLLAWVVLPLSLYFDLQYVDYHVDEWPLSGRLYIAGAAILPVLTQVLGAAALFIDIGGTALAAVVPVILLALSVRHLRTRSRLV